MDRSEDKPDRFWNWIAGSYDRQVQKDEDYDRAIDRIGEFLDADDIVLDYACGPGVVALAIAGQVKKVHAIDLSDKMIEIARTRGRERGLSNVQFDRTTIFDESLEAGTFDVILAFNILHLLEDAGEAVRRASELSKPGGLMISVTPCVQDAGRLTRIWLRLVGRILPLSYLRSFTASDVQTLIQDGGFEILETEEDVDRRLPICRVVARLRGES